MPVVDKKKLRKDVRELVEERQQLQVQGIAEFVRRSENQAFDFRVLWKKVMAGNMRFFENRGRDEQLDSLLSEAEMHWLVKLHRFTADYVSRAMLPKRPLPASLDIEQVNLDGVSAEWQTMHGTGRNQVLMYLHGGGWILDSPRNYRPLTAAIAESARVSVLSVAYRLAPEHPFPALLEDCVACYKGLLARGVSPAGIVIGGDSAGGNLTLASLLYLRDHDIPMPAAAVVLSPSTDLAHADDTYFANGKTDPILADAGVFWWGSVYADGTDFSHPMLSPIQADLNGLPPLLIQVSTSEMLYGEAQRFAVKAENAGGDVTLDGWDDMPHVFQLFGLHCLQEADAAIEGIGAFVQKALGPS